MRRIWCFLSDPGLHLLTIALVLIGLAIGSSGSREPAGESSLVYCKKCGIGDFRGPTDSCPARGELAQARP